MHVLTVLVHGDSGRLSVAGIASDNIFLLPKRHSSFKSRDEFSRKKVKQWVAGLAVGDAGKTSLVLYEKLDRLNSLEITPVHRFELLSLLQPPLDFALDTLKQSCMGGVAPLGIELRMAADLRMDIMVQIVKGYKTVLAQFHDATITGQLLHKNTRAEALRSALFYLGEILLHSYMTYQSCPAYTWKELHGIYYYSVVNELQMARRTHGNDERQDRLGIVDLYKQILLLSLADPNSMLRGEVERVNSKLKNWLPLVDLVPIKGAVTAKSIFLIDAQSDEPPCAPYLSKKDKLDAGWYLVTDKLKRMLKKRLAVAEASRLQGINITRPSDAGTLRLLRKLRASWSQQIRSREVRDHASDVVEVICGLDSLYRIHGGDRLAGSDPKRAVAGAEPYPPGQQKIDSAILDDTEVLIEVGPGVLELHRVKEEAIRQAETERSDVAVKECITTNVSENGYYLNWPDTGEDGARVGELVGVNPIPGNGDLSKPNLGVIRWMTLGQAGFLGMGVELLHGLTEAVILQRRGKEEKAAEYIKGFLQYEKGSGSVSLIAPPFYLGEKDRYRVISTGREISVDLTNIVESTDSFVRFELERDSRGKQHPDR